MEVEDAVEADCEVEVDVEVVTGGLPSNENGRRLSGGSEASSKGWNLMSSSSGLGEMDEEEDEEEGEVDELISSPSDSDDLLSPIGSECEVVVE